MDQTRKGQFNFRSTGIKIEWNRMELEWKWNGNFTTKDIDAKQNGNGMEINGHSLLEVKLNGVEQKRKGNGVERLW